MTQDPVGASHEKHACEINKGLAICPDEAMFDVQSRQPPFAE